MKRPSILVVDDERLIRWSIAAELEERGYEAREAESAAQARKELSRGVDAVVLDNDLAPAEKGALLEELRSLTPALPVIVLTGDNGQTDQSIRDLATQLVEKPFEPQKLGAAVDGLCRRAAADGDELLQRESARALDRLRGHSAAMDALKHALSEAADSPARAILVTGEPGTGRHLAARVLHELSERAERPLRVLCAGQRSRVALDALLAECSGGTLLVEGVDGLDDDIQEGLIQFLETRSETRVIILAGDVSAAVGRGALRADLYELLAAARIHVPPLREREGDVALLAHHFVTKLSGLIDTSVHAIDESAVSVLERHDWPGNVRELRDVIERAMLLGSTHTLGADDFSRLAQNGHSSAAAYTLPPGGVDLKELERNLVIQALERTGGNRTRAAELLRMTRDQMRYRVAKFNLD